MTGIDQAFGAAGAERVAPTYTGEMPEGAPTRSKEIRNGLGCVRHLFVKENANFSLAHFATQGVLTQELSKTGKAFHGIKKKDLLSRCC